MVQVVPTAHKVFWRRILTSTSALIPERAPDMPLVHIHVLRSARRSPECLRLLADSIQEVMQSHFHAPPRDRYQIISQHDEGELICEDSQLPGLPRSEQLVLLQIFQQGRDKQTKEATYNELMKQLGEKCGLGEPPPHHQRKKAGKCRHS